ncbi:MAG: ComF family protein [Rhodoluna sp.]
MKILDAALDLILPTPCILCGRKGAALCKNCRQFIHASRRAVARPGISGWAVSEYGENQRRIFHEFKESGLTSLVGCLADLLAPELEWIRSKFETEAPVFLVPMPSSRANFKKRGYNPAKLLASRTNRRARRPFMVLDALKSVRDTSDQAGLTTAERQTNVAGAMQVKRSVQGARVLLFDDVVTTGATLAEAARALSEAGAEVLGFLVFSETLLKTQAKS